MSRALGKLVGQADLGPVKSAFIHVGLKHRAIKLYISPSPAVRSSNQTDVFVKKDAAFPPSFMHLNLKGQLRGQLLGSDFGNHIAINEFRGFFVGPRPI